MEKDWWVTAILEAVYALDYGSKIQFKGGTSLSKCWTLISRFSEDLDLAIDPSLLGFGENLSKSQVSNRLRRASKGFIEGRFLNDLKESVTKGGLPIDSLSFSSNSNEIPTQDPVQIYIEYPTLFPEDDYISHCPGDNGTF